MKRLPHRTTPLGYCPGGILSCEGIIFDSRNACPLCGGKVSGYDTKKKQFAVIQENNGVKPVQVFIRRFACRECHAVCYADEPFYPDTRAGSPSGRSLQNSR